MRTNRPRRTRFALRLLSSSFSVALLAMGGTALAQAGAPAANEKEPAAAPAEAPAPAPTAAAPAGAPPAAAPAVAAEPEPAVAGTEQGAAPTTAKRKHGAASQIGLNPQDTLVSGVAGPPAAAEAAPSEDWGFKFHGYFRGPMRLSFGKEGGDLQAHAPPVTPDLNYTTWQYTNNNPGQWAELMFQYGNNRAVMTAAIAAYNITSGSWRELQDQLGIDRAFLTLNFPDALGDLGKLTINAGVFSNRYGAMGKYDAGAYETYLMGRTRIAGLTSTFDLDLADDFKVVAEGGIGAKMDQQQWQFFPYTSWQPYPGKAQMGTALLAHGHLGVVWQNMLTLTGHAIYTWTADNMRVGMNSAANAAANPVPDFYAPSDTSKTGDPGLLATARNGSIRILGGDLRLDGGWLGDGYIGFSQIKAKNALVISDSIEVLHSQGGWQLTNNYLGDRGNGTIYNIGFQHTFSLAAFMLRPQAWWGQGADFTLQLFGIYTWIEDTGPVNPTTWSAGITNTTSTGLNNPDALGTKKLKLGATPMYTPLPFMSIGARVDWVQPNMDNSTHNFWVFSPRMIFRTEFVTHEMITVQYQYYSYGSWYGRPNNGIPGGTTPALPGMAWPGLPAPYGQAGNLWNPKQADKHTFTIAASMWW